MKIVTDQEVIRTCNNLEMIRRRHLWTAMNGFALPLKKPKLLQKSFSDDGAFGVLLNQEGAENTVFLTNVFAPDLQAEQIKYDSPEAIVADGWVVD